MEQGGGEYVFILECEACVPGPLVLLAYDARQKFGSRLMETDALMQT